MRVNNLLFNRIYNNCFFSCFRYSIYGIISDI